MVLRTLVLPVCLSFGVAACGNANAAALDPSRDVDCSVLTFYFKGLADHQGAPADQQHALAAMHEWYAVKTRALAVERWGDMEGLAGEVGPLLDAIKRDPMSMLDELAACTERAVEDPDFDRFARTFSG